MPSQSDEIDFTRLSSLKNYNVRPIDILVLVVIIACAIPLFSILSGIYVTLLGLVIFFGGCWAIWRRTSAVDAQNKAAYQAFCQENGFVYTPYMAFDAASQKGTMFHHGHSPAQSNDISGLFCGLSFSLYTYNYSEGSGKSRRDYDLEVMELTLPRTLPHMVIDSLVEETNNGLSTLPIAFDRSQKIELEGDFNKYFSLYAPDDYGISALTILAPDAMEALMRHAALCDIEIIDNKLYFYWPVVASNEAQYREVFATVAEVLNEIGAKLKKSDIFKDVSQARVASEVNQAGPRLRSNHLTAVYIVAIFAIIFLLASGSFYGVSSGIISQGLGFGIIFVGVCVLLYRAQRRQRLRAQLTERFTRTKKRQSL